MCDLEYYDDESRELMHTTYINYLCGYKLKFYYQL
jgi:hypothetical protein